MGYPEFIRWGFSKDIELIKMYSYNFHTKFVLYVEVMNFFSTISRDGYLKSVIFVNQFLNTKYEMPAFVTSYF